MTVFCRLAGGYGNQLFQVAKALDVASGDELIYLSTFGLSRYKAKRQPFPYIVENNRFRMLSVWKSLALELRIPKFINVIKKLLKIQENTDCIFCLGNVKIVDGYYQDKLHIGLDRLKCLLLESMPIDPVKHTNIALHFRSTDAAQYFDTNKLVGYFKAAITYCSLHYDKSSQIKIVTDDVDTAKAFFRSLSLEGVASCFVGKSDIDDFIYMCNSQAVISSPSTFSWWAGYLSNRLFITPGYFLDNDIRDWTAHNECKFV